MSAAMQAVFGTAELLEDILTKALLHGMTQRELLFAQRVSQSWRGTIIGSPLLQKALFFRPATTREDLEFFRQWYRDEPRCYDRVRLGTTASSDYIGFGTRLSQAPILPPFLSQYGARKSCDICDDELYQQYLAGKLPEGWDRYLAMSRRKYELWTNPEASVHRMLVCQPPANAVEVLFTRERYQDPNQKTFKADRDAMGVTAGDAFLFAVESGLGGGKRNGYRLEEPYNVDASVTRLLQGFWASASTYPEE